MGGFTDSKYVYVIKRHNNSIVKRQDVLILDKPVSWYDQYFLHLSCVNRTYNFLNLFVNESNPLPSRPSIFSILDTYSSIFIKLAKVYELTFILYKTRHINQFIGFIFQDEKKELLFRLKYPIIDCRCDNILFL